MAALTSILLGASAAIGAGTSIAQAVGASNAKKEAKAEANKQKAKQDKMLAQEKARQAQEDHEAGAIKKRNQQRARQEASRRSAQGREGTILTKDAGLGAPAGGSQGNQSLGGGAGKTLLGM